MFNGEAGILQQFTGLCHSILDEIAVETNALFSKKFCQVTAV